MDRTRKAILLGVLFVGTGLLTFQVYYWVSKTIAEQYQLAAQLLTGVPFGLACSLRFMRVGRWIAVGVLLDCIIWVAAYRLALVYVRNAFVSMIAAGILGAVGVTLATGLGCMSLYRLPVLSRAALVGAITGIPFGFIPNHTDQENFILALAFPLWQVAVGLWIWMSSTES